MFLPSFLLRLSGKEGKGEGNKLSCFKSTSAEGGGRNEERKAGAAQSCHYNCTVYIPENASFAPTVPQCDHISQLASNRNTGTKSCTTNALHGGTFHSITRCSQINDATPIRSADVEQQVIGAVIWQRLSEQLLFPACSRIGEEISPSDDGGLESAPSSLSNIPS